MSFSEEFRTQWTSLSNYILSDLIKNSSSKTFSTSEEAGKLYKNEILRWEVDGQYNAEWLNNLRSADATVATEFENKLKSFCFNKVEQSKQKNGLNYVAAGAGGAVGIGIGALLKWGTVAIVGTGVVAAIAGAAIGSKISNGQNVKKSDAEIDEYKKQLSEYGELLLIIVKRADGKEPIGM